MVDRRRILYHAPGNILPRHGEERPECVGHCPMDVPSMVWGKRGSQRVLLPCLPLLVFQETSKSIDSVLAKPVSKMSDTLFGHSQASLYGIDGSVHLRLSLSGQYDFIFTGISPFYHSFFIATGVTSNQLLIVSLARYEYH